MKKTSADSFFATFESLDEAIGYERSKNCEIHQIEQIVIDEFDYAKDDFVTRHLLLTELKPRSIND